MNQYKKISVRAMALLVSTTGHVALAIKKTGPEPNCWDLPGGGIKPGERLLDALSREIKEEIGLEPEQYEIGSLLMVAEKFFPDFGENGLHSLSIIYHCSTDAEPAICSQELQTGEARWFSPKDLDRTKCSE